MRRSILTSVALLAGAASPASIVATLPSTAEAAVSVPAPQAKPNIVLITIDDARYDDQQVLDNVQRLVGARAGLGGSYRNLVGATPLCSPTRATWLTGQYAHNHGVWDNNPDDGQGWPAFRPSEANALPVWLQDAGYRTGFLGKYINGYTDPTHVPDGWNRWKVGVGKTTYNYRNFTISDNGVARSINGGAYSTNWYGSQAVDWINDWTSDLAPRPFYLQVNFVAPHDPATPADHYRDTVNAGRPESLAFDEADVTDKPSWIRAKDRMTDTEIATRIDKRNQRLETLKSVDDQVGRIVDALRTNRVLANTLIIVTSDNGFLLGEHRIQFGKNYPYNESVRLPLFIRGPGFRTRQLDMPVSTVDIAPTIAQAAGAQPRGSFEWDGKPIQNGISSDRVRLIESRGYMSLPPYKAAIDGDGALYVEYVGDETELYRADDTDQRFSRDQSQDPDDIALKLALETELTAMRQAIR